MVRDLDDTKRSTSGSRLLRQFFGEYRRCNRKKIRHSSRGVRSWLGDDGLHGDICGCFKAPVRDRFRMNACHIGWYKRQGEPGRYQVECQHEFW